MAYPDHSYSQDTSHRRRRSRSPRSTQHNGTYDYRHEMTTQQQYSTQHSIGTNGNNYGASDRAQQASYPMQYNNGAHQPRPSQTYHHTPGPTIPQQQQQQQQQYMNVNNSYSMTTAPGNYQGNYQMATHQSPSQYSPVTDNAHSEGYDQQEQAAMKLSRERLDMQRPPGTCKIHKGWKFRLEVMQHPDRARMCGFGDKDRRPVAPFLIARLIMTPADGGPEADYGKLENLNRFLCQVDLWDTAGLCANLNLGSSVQSPTISSTTTAEYPMTVCAPGHSFVPPQTLPTPYNGQQVPYGSVAPYDPRQPIYRRNQSAYGRQQMPDGGNSSANRTLLGSCNAQAQKLTDIDGTKGLFFLFSDLSVRQEGLFRLKIKLFDVKHSLDLFGPASDQGVDREGPCLATAYSKVFQVFSAKKFPGVPDSTERSRCFAQQGQKISIRKDPAKGDGRDGSKRKRNDGRDDEDDF